MRSSYSVPSTSEKERGQLSVVEKRECVEQKMEEEKVPEPIIHRPLCHLYQWGVMVIVMAMVMDAGNAGSAVVQLPC
jgi:hypothetical protein